MFSSGESVWFILLIWSFRITYEHFNLTANTSSFYLSIPSTLHFIKLMLLSSLNVSLCLCSLCFKRLTFHCKLCIWFCSIIPSSCLQSISHCSFPLSGFSEAVIPCQPCNSTPLMLFNAERSVFGGSFYPECLTVSWVCTDLAWLAHWESNLQLHRIGGTLCAVLGNILYCFLVLFCFICCCFIGDYNLHLF